LLLTAIFLSLDFENHFQEIGIIRREVIVVNHFCTRYEMREKRKGNHRRRDSEKGKG
jgi:hypothetical protein